MGYIIFLTSVMLVITMILCKTLLLITLYCLGLFEKEEIKVKISNFIKYNKNFIIKIYFIHYIFYFVFLILTILGSDHLYDTYGSWTPFIIGRYFYYGLRDAEDIIIFIITTVLMLPFHIALDLYTFTFGLVLKMIKGLHSGYSAYYYGIYELLDISYYGHFIVYFFSFIYLLFILILAKSIYRKLKSKSKKDS